jgi:hypothetical protein
MAQAPSVLPNARPPAQRHTPMVSYTMTYLREEINHHRGGDDSCTAIKPNTETQTQGSSNSNNNNNKKKKKKVDDNQPLA